MIIYCSTVTCLAISHLYATLSVQSEQVQMELDTGAAVSVMSEQTYIVIWNDGKAPYIQPAKVQLYSTQVTLSLLWESFISSVRTRLKQKESSG